MSDRLESAARGRSLVIKFTNVIAFALFFGSTIYSSFSSPKLASTIISATPIVQDAWKLINILFLGFVIYQFVGNSTDSVNIIGYRFALLGLVNSIYLSLLTKSHTVLAFIFSLIVLSLVSEVYYQLRRFHTHIHSATEVWLVHLPFSLWHAWAVYSVWLTGYAAFVPHHGHKIIQDTVGIIAIFFLTLTATGYALQSAQGDVAGAAVLTFILLGITQHQKATIIKIAAGVGAIISLIDTLKAAYYTYTKDRTITDEQEPILSNSNSA